MTASTVPTVRERCGVCFNCEHVAAAARHYSSSPTDRRQFRDLGAMFPCEAGRVFLQRDTACCPRCAGPVRHEGRLAWCADRCDQTEEVTP